VSLAPEGKRILLVEDDPGLRDLIIAQLGQAAYGGLEVSGASPW